jgi:hypothetical protein
MDYWRRSVALREQAWDFLQRVVRPDVALLQEAEATGRGSCTVFREGGIRDDRRQPPRDLAWGSAIVSYGPALRSVTEVVGPYSKAPIALHRSFPGTVAIAEVLGEVPFIVVSAYGLIDHGYADTTMHRVLSDLTPLIDQRRGRGIIVAGDFNITTQWSAKHKSFLRGRHEDCLRRDQNLFARFEALGLRNVAVRTKPGPLEGCDCHAGPECRHVQTQRHERSEFPWQNDYFFISEDLLAQPHTVEILDQEDAWKLSGHCPIVVEFSAL